MQVTRPCLGLTLLIAVAPLLTVGAANRPNFVVIFIDDMGYGDIGPFGSKLNETPHLDRMAAEGMKLTSFYVASPVCSPSRAALMTGCYPYRRSDSANPMRLYAQDWTGGYCDNGHNLRRGTAEGVWNVIVDRAGVYELELRRWPKESNKPLTEGFKGPQARDASARPIAAANLQVSGANYTLDTRPEDTHAAFCIRLPAGKTRLATTLMDANDRALCSAIYVTIERIPETKAANAPLTPTTARKPKGRPGTTR